MSRSGIILCYPFEEKRLRKWRAPYIIQPKLDGERCRAIFDSNGKVTLLSSEQNEFTSVPHINQQLESTGLHDIELDGELYTHGMCFENIHSIVSRKQNLHPDFMFMEYHVFDIVVNANMEFRLLAKDTLFDSIKLRNVKDVKHFEANTLDDIMLYFDLFCKEGFEGFVLRNREGYYTRSRSTNLMKFKPKKTDIYRIVDTIEEVSITGQKKGTLGALACMGDDGTIFTVGSGLTADMRREYWKARETLVSQWCEVQYQHITTGKRVPRFPVFVRILKDL